MRVKAFQDGISVPQFYALVGSKHFDSTIATTGFEPDLNVIGNLNIGNLNKGETSEGWVVFDVPSGGHRRHRLRCSYATHGSVCNAQPTTKQQHT